MVDLLVLAKPWNTQNVIMQSWSTEANLGRLAGLIREYDSVHCLLLRNPFCLQPLALPAHLWTSVTRVPWRGELKDSTQVCQSLIPEELCRNRGIVSFNFKEDGNYEGAQKIMSQIVMREDTKFTELFSSFYITLNILWLVLFWGKTHLILLRAQWSHLEVLRRLYVVPGMEMGSAMCKSSTLTPVQFLGIIIIRFNLWDK